MDEMEQMWVATVKLATELKKRNISSTSALKSLRNAKSILNECRLDSKSEIEGIAAVLIENAQRELLSLSAPLGEKFVLGWEKQFTGVMKGKKAGGFSIPQVKFFQNTPRSNWVRFSRPNGLDNEKIKEITKKCRVSFQLQDNYVLIFGDAPSIREALNEVSPYFR